MTTRYGMGRGVLRAAGAAIIASVGVVGSSGPVEAHPFGPPQTVTIEPGDRAGVVEVHWLPGAADDYSYLARGLGLITSDRTTEPGALLYVKADADRLAASPRFERYVTRHLSVTDEGRPCAGELAPIGRLVGDGVRLTFDCAGPVDEVQVDVSMLTDLHPSYRTMATGPHGQRFVYTADATSHGWSFTAAAPTESRGVSALLQISAVLAVICVLAGAAALLIRTRRQAPS